MADEKKTHRLVKTPQISARYLADYMAATDVARRTILVGSKYQPIARVVQHDEAKTTLSKFFRAENPETDDLVAAAAKLRARMADTPFDRDVLDHNADYLDRAAKVAGEIELPRADVLPAGPTAPIIIEGVRVRPDIQFRLRRVTKTNKVRVGAATFRYAKGKALKVDVGEWQSAFLLAYLRVTEMEEEADSERALCLTIDTYSGNVIVAPGDSVNRYKNMVAACAAIAERWDNIQPPANAVI